jgi:hypothetical protein
VESQGVVRSSPVSLSDLQSFSFRQSSVLVVENFWSADERQYFRDAMNQAAWKSLSDLPKVREDFPDSGNWAKAEIGPAQGNRFLSRLQLPCIQEHMESFPNITGRHMGFSYYSYSAGDCLLTHDDTDQGQPVGGRRAPSRRIALVSYFHEEWIDQGADSMPPVRLTRQTSRRCPLRTVSSRVLALWSCSPCRGFTVCAGSIKRPVNTGDFPSPGGS